MAEKVPELEAIFTAAKAFVERNYEGRDPSKNLAGVPMDRKDKSIKILATMNQLIELKKMPPDMNKLIREIMQPKTPAGMQPLESRPP